MDVEMNVATFDSERQQAKEKKRTRRDSAKAKEHVTITPPSTVTATLVSPVNGAKRSGKLGDRKSRSLYGRGLPKKGGAGGKGTWGRPGDEIDQVGVLDDHDPNYDSEELDQDTVFKSVKPQWNQDEIEKTVTPILKEYFEHMQKDEVTELLSDLNIDGKKPLVVVYLITLAMERKCEFRELASQLLGFFATPSHHNQVNGTEKVNGISGQFRAPFMSREDIRNGFCAIRASLPQLVLDTPDATEVLGKFLARAIFDKILSKDILEDYHVVPGEEDAKLTKACATEAHCLMAIPHNNLKYVWGVGGGNQPLEVLREKMMALLKEYLSSGDSEEAIRCVRDLDVPHYHHELVYELIVMAIEVSTKRAISMMVHVLKRFYDTAVVTPNQLSQGVLRVYTEMGEICIDVPNAHIYLEEFVDMAYNLKVISHSLKVQAPKRTRKRFVSEGDGGKWKNSRDNYFDLV